MISYTITACDEHQELDKLLNYLRTSIRVDDEIIVQLDSDSVTEDVRRVATTYANMIPTLRVIEFPLNNNFAAFKNNIKSHCKQDWIFNIDADEMPSEFLVDNLYNILRENSDLDVLMVPRWNIVNGITENHVKKWRWTVTNLDDEISEKIIDTDDEEYKFLKKLGCIIEEIGI
jgi:glycosyltransferase involved in cell wall biosynthesis